MKRTAILLTLTLALLTGACGGESNLPVATGKASIRAINAIKASPNVSFRIEERVVNDLPYQHSSGLTQYDDLDYTFNFDIVYAGDGTSTRIASQYIDFVDGQEYTLLLNGTVSNPVITLWENEEREFAAGGTVFQVRFSHNSEYLASTRLAGLDYYLAPTGVAPAAGQEVATVAFGALSPAVDVEAGPLVLIITGAGDPNDILYTSNDFDYAAGTDLIITPFDSTPSRLGDFTVHILGQQAGTSELVDSTAQATVQFLHAASDLGAVNIYDDEMLTSLVLADHMYTDFSAEIPVTPGDITFRYTPTMPVGSTTVLVQGDLPALAGSRYRFAVTGVNTDFTTTALLPDRRSVETSAKLLIAQASNNFIYMEFYLVDSGEVIDDSNRLERILTSGVPNIASGMPAGNYDIYVTDADPTDILAGPIPLNVVLGDVVDIMIFDDPADPTVLDVQFLSGP